MSNNPADLTGVMGEHTHFTHMHIHDSSTFLNITDSVILRKVELYHVLNTWGRGGDLKDALK